MGPLKDVHEALNYHFSPRLCDPIGIRSRLQLWPTRLVGRPRRRLAPRSLDLALTDGGCAPNRSCTFSGPTSRNLSRVYDVATSEMGVQGSVISVAAGALAVFKRDEAHILNDS